MKTAIVATALALSLVAPGMAAGKPAKHRSTAKHHVVQRPQQIACTVVGCVPVPRGCYPTEGRTWSGMPTGGDVIVCPPGVQPFK